MSGGAFLILYIGLLIVATVVSLVGVAKVRPDGRVVDRPDPETVAWLGGGRLRLFDTLAARDLADGRLGVTGRKLATADGTPVHWGQVKSGFGGRAEDVERRLTREGQLADADDYAGMKRWATLPFLALAALGVARMIYGLAIGQEVGFLVGLLFITFIVWMSRRSGLDRRTRGGKETLYRARTAHDRLRRAPTQPEMGMAVALFGTTVLAGSAFAGFHDMRQRSSDGGDSGSSSDSGGGSDGGCGGGGCGGCGGGGD